MKWNPYINALAAAVYIALIGFLISYIGSLHRDTPDNLIGTLTAISLMVFSAATMAFLFFYRPVALLFENKKEEAISFFLKTLGTFGVITLLAVLTLI
jgi:hypothetical protein